MKNIFLLPTEKPSRLFKFANELHLDTIPKDYYKKYHIYITSDEDIKEGDWGLSKLNEVILFGRSYNEKFYKKIILTTDQDLIKDGVQSIDNDFLEWFVKNPSCEKVETTRDFADEGIKGITYYGKYFIIIPQEEPKQETLEEAAEKYAEENANDGNISYHNLYAPLEYAFRNGAEWQAERMYSEDELRNAVEISVAIAIGASRFIINEESFKKLKKQIK